MNSTSLQVSGGVVSFVNAQRDSFQLQGSGQWYNFSRNSNIPAPAIGAAVEVSWNPWTPPSGGATRRYVESWRSMPSNRGQRGYNGGMPSGQLDAGDGVDEDGPYRREAEAAYESGYTAAVEQAPRNATPEDIRALDPRPQWLSDSKPVVTRLACLNTATAIYGGLWGPSWPTTTSEEDHESNILGLAERLVTWATWGGGKV